MNFALASALVAAVQAQCTTGVCIFSNGLLRFGSGAEHSINVQGNLLQPWYFNSTRNTWLPLTSGNNPLDMAVGLDNNAVAHWTSST